jgi:hypothetical protein
MSVTATTVFPDAQTRWHRPLLWLSFGTAAAMLATLAGLIFDTRLLDGAPLWAKPLKFSISILVYALTLSWHALQVIPLAALLLELAARRIPGLRAAATRVELLWILVMSYLGALALRTAQALAGQSVVRREGAFTIWGVTLFAAAGLAAVVVLARGLRAVGALPPAG